MNAPSLIQGSSAVLAEFAGAWPSFHDAEVESFHLDRGNFNSERKVIAEMRVHIRRYEPRNVGTVDYHQALVKSVVIEFRFTDVEDLSVSEFNHQNVIQDIVVSDGLGKGLSVDVQGIYGFDGSWKCRSAEVLRVTRSEGEV